MGHSQGYEKWFGVEVRAIARLQQLPVEPSISRLVSKLLTRLNDKLDNTSERSNRQIVRSFSVFDKVSRKALAQSHLL